MKMLRYTAIAIIGLALAACTKDHSSEGNPPPTPAGSFAPYTTGSVFTYQDVTVAGDTTQYTVTVTGDTTISGDSYKILSFSSGTQTYNRSDAAGNYYQIASNLSYQNYSFASFKSLYLKTSASVNATWNDTVTVSVSGLSQRGQLTYQLTQKGVAKTVAGKAYTGVSAVATTGKLLDLPIPVSLSLNTNYYVPGVGLIETDTQADTVRLVSYTIK